MDSQSTNPTGPTFLLPLSPEPPPLRLDDGGVVRIANSRVTLDLVVEQYENGMTPEDLVRAYDALALADVYAVIGYYLKHKTVVREYLNRREQEAAALRAQIESERPNIARDDLLIKRTAREKVDAAARQ
jgi:uncharacterized protein (DUF433 family)